MADLGWPASYDDEGNPDDLAGAEILGLVHRALARYVVLPSPEAADAIVLWIAATHAVPAWNCAPRLDITSPVKRCGKSRLLDIIEATCYAPLITVNISPAALVRSIGADPPTLLLDEADTVFGPKAADNHEDLRGILNAGHARNRPYIRWDVTIRATEECPTFAMAALAGIGALPETITDRAVVVSMRRRAPGESVARYRNRRDGDPLRELGVRLGAWVRAHRDELGEAEPDMPVEDRAADTWEPLIAVADLAGGDWPARARTAAVALTAEDDADTSLGTRLLADVREVFGGADAMHTEAILDGLHKISEAPWGDWYGHPLNPRDLAKLLRPYSVRSVDVKADAVNRKGYRRGHLHDPWSRYLPPEPGGSATGATCATAQVSEPGEVAGSASQRLPATSDPPVTRAVAQVAEVAAPLARVAANGPRAPSAPQRTSRSPAPRTGNRRTERSTTMSSDPAWDAERRRALRDEEERARRAGLHDIRNWTRKRPELDPVHLVLIRLPGLPPRRAAVTWSLLARLAGEGAGAEFTDLGVVDVDFDRAAFGNGTRILWLRDSPR